MFHIKDHSADPVTRKQPSACKIREKTHLGVNTGNKIYSTSGDILRQGGQHFYFLVPYFPPNIQLF